MTSSTPDEQITREEEELYDRQIRLWGASGQIRLRQTKVLVIGMKGVGNELCKMLVLAGVHTVEIMDNENVTEVEYQSKSEYFIDKEGIGKNRAEASLDRLKILNPKVIVVANTSTVELQNSEFFQKFDIICVTIPSVELITKLEGIAEASKIKLFVAWSCGLLGLAYHRMWLDTDSGLRLKNTLELPLDTMRYGKWRFAVHTTYLIYIVAMRFMEEKKRIPDRANFEEDLKHLSEIRDEVYAECPPTNGLIHDIALRNLFGEFGEQCTIVGGFVAQEIIRMITGEDGDLGKYLGPFFLFDPIYFHFGEVKFPEFVAVKKNRQCNIGDYG